MQDLIDSPDIFSVDAETSVEEACDVSTPCMNYLIDYNHE